MLVVAIFVHVSLLFPQASEDSIGDKDGGNIVVDYRGNPVDNSRTGGWLAAGLILGTYFPTLMIKFLLVHVYNTSPGFMGSSFISLTSLKTLLIAGTELSERVCVMGISMNLVTYLVGDLHLSAARSANIVTNFMGTLNLLGLLGGFLADAKLGRYLTVAIFASICATPSIWHVVKVVLIGLGLYMSHFIVRAKLFYF